MEEKEFHDFVKKVGQSLADGLCGEVILPSREPEPIIIGVPHVASIRNYSLMPSTIVIDDVDEQKTCPEEWFKHYFPQYAGNETLIHHPFLDWARDMDSYGFVEKPDNTIGVRHRLTYADIAGMMSYADRVYRNGPYPIVGGSFLGLDQAEKKAEKLQRSLVEFSRGGCNKPSKRPTNLTPKKKKRRRK